MLIVLAMSGKRLFEFMGMLVARQLGGGPLLSADSESVVANGHAILGGLTKALLPVLAMGMGLAIMINLLQIGPLFLTDKLARHHSPRPATRSAANLLDAQPDAADVRYLQADHHRHRGAGQPLRSSTRDLEPGRDRIDTERLVRMGYLFLDGD